MGIFGNKPETPGTTIRPSEPLGKVAPAPQPTPAPRFTPPAPVAAAPEPTTSPSPARKSAGPCVIASGISISGEISGDEDVVIEGRVEGNIRVGRDLKVAPSGMVKATVEAQSIAVAGELIGDCLATGRVEIQATGRVTGNIRAPKIVIAEGAMFKGMSDMSGRTERKDRIAGVSS